MRRICRHRRFFEVSVCSFCRYLSGAALRPFPQFVQHRVGHVMLESSMGEGTGCWSTGLWMLLLPMAENAQTTCPASRVPPFIDPKHPCQKRHCFTETIYAFVLVMSLSSQTERKPTKAHIANVTIRAETMVLLAKKSTFRIAVLSCNLHLLFSFKWVILYMYHEGVQNSCSIWTQLEAAVPSRRHRFYVQVVICCTHTVSSPNQGWKQMRKKCLILHHLRAVSTKTYNSPARYVCNVPAHLSLLHLNFPAY